MARGHRGRRPTIGKSRCLSGAVPRLERLENRSILSTTGAGPAGPVLASYGPRFDYDPSSILVRFRPDVTDVRSASLLPGTEVAPATATLVPGLHRVTLSPGVGVEQALEACRASPLVLYAEPNGRLHTTAVPNDPYYADPDMDHLRTIGMEAAWDVTTGDTSVPIADIDTGLAYDHPDVYLNVWINQAEIPYSRLKNLTDVDGDGLITFWDLNDPVNQGPGKITDVNGDGRIDAADILAPMVLDAAGNDTGAGGWAYPGNTQDGDTAHPNDFIGWNFLDNTNNPLDTGHGTHTFGTLGAVGNNGEGVTGVNWKAQIAALKAFDGGTWDDAANAVNYAVVHGFPISNNSWGGEGRSQALADVLQAAHDAGHLFVAAAGNDGQNNDTYDFYPAGFARELDNVVAVAATDRQDQRAVFSDYGPNSVLLAAPGVSVLSTYGANGYVSLSGTSTAAPAVAGVAALVWELHPDWRYTDVINQLAATVDPLPGLAGQTITGGRLDAARAVGAVNRPPGSEPAGRLRALAPPPAAERVSAYLQKPPLTASVVSRAPAGRHEPATLLPAPAHDGQALNPPARATAAVADDVKRDLPAPLRPRRLFPHDADAPSDQISLDFLFESLSILAFWT